LGCAKDDDAGEEPADAAVDAALDCVFVGLVCLVADVLMACH
jgi:hypothetical protein